MKMTMHIDEELLTKVMNENGFHSKTEAVNQALKEMHRRHRFSNYIATTSHMSPEECMGGVDPNYDIHSLRVAESRTRYRKTENGI